jgi:hypothetical protein
MCKYKNGCNSYDPKECYCESELCFLYQMFLGEEIKQGVYVRKKDKSK